MTDPQGQSNQYQKSDDTPETTTPDPDVAEEYEVNYLSTPAGSSESVESEQLVTTSPSASTPENESTIGTGTSMALGCVSGTVVLIIFGLLFLAVNAIR